MCAKPWLMVVTLGLAECTFAAGVAVDAEPNDTIDTATVTGLFGEGEVLVLGAAIGNGPLGAGDRDFFAFETGHFSSPLLLTVTMVAADNDFDGYLRLFDAEGREMLTQDDDGASVNPRLQTYVFPFDSHPYNATYVIAVSHSLNPGYSATDDQTGRDAETGGYLLSIELTTVTVAATSLEPPYYEAPIPIESVPTTLFNQFIGDGEHQRRDIDTYVVEVDGPSIVTAEVTPVQLKLLNPIVNGVYEDLRPDLRVRRARFAVYEAGPVEITVRGTWGAPDVPVGRSVGYYNISIDATPVPADPLDGPLEPDDSLLGATVAGLAGPGTVTYSAYIGDGQFGATRGDIDAYEITLSGSETLAVDVSPTDTLAATVHLHDYLGARLQSWMPDASGAVHLTFAPPPAVEPQTFVVVVMGTGDRVTMDPFVPNYDPYPSYPNPDDDRQALDAIDGGPGSTGAYDVTFTIFPTLSDAPPSPPPPELDSDEPETAVHAQDTTQGPPVPRRVFATLPDATASAIVELNPSDGSIVNEFQTPEVPLGLYDGIAYDGTDVYLLGSSGQYPYLYRLNADTGDVLERTLAWFGSGFYGDMAILDDTLYVVDLFESRVYAMPASFNGTVRRLEMGGLAGVSMFGAIATATSPDRLLVTDAEDPSLILELDPEDGLPMSFLSLKSPCRCDADFDHDGDVDDDDVAFFDVCTFQAQAVLDCVVADLDCDGFVVPLDRAILNCQYNGPDAPPNAGCCPDDLPDVSVRGTSLAAVYPHVLLAGDWSARGLERFDRTGESLGPLALADPVGSLASGPLALFGDSDNDSDVDLLDWARLQDCFSADGNATLESDCAVFDYDVDLDVDLDDFSEFQAAFTGTAQ